MLQTVEGVYRNGQIELSESPPGVTGDVPVLVTFMWAGETDLRKRGIDESQAAEMRGRLACIAEDWESPEMDVYDDYEANRRKLEAG